MIFTLTAREAVYCGISFSDSVGFSSSASLFSFGFAVSASLTGASETSGETACAGGISVFAGFPASLTSFSGDSLFSSSAAGSCARGST